MTDLGGWQAALPGIIVATTALLVMTLDLFMRGPDRDALCVLGIGGLVLTIAGTLAMWGTSDVAAFGNTLRADRYALFFAVVITAGSLLTLLVSVDYLRRQPIPSGEYLTLVLLSTSGMVFLAAANDLIVLFLALEIMSVAAYVLAGLFRHEVRSTEAALKYFLLGAFATGFLLYGIAFFYAASGSTRLDVAAC